MSSKKGYREDYVKVRFHVEFGPPSLFERVRYKMQNVTKLYLEGAHFTKRVQEREIPRNVMDELLQFDIDTWSLKTAEVREDRGKFVNSTWEKVIDGVPYWVTIGMGNYIKTIVIRTSSGMDKCVRNGEFYDFVEQVNRGLMDEDTRADGQ